VRSSNTIFLIWLYDVKLWEYLTQELTWTKIIAIIGKFSVI